MLEPKWASSYSTSGSFGLMGANSGYGQQIPTDGGSGFNQIAFIIKQMMAKLAVMKLVQVQAVHSNGPLAAAGTVDVLPLVSQVDGNFNTTPHGVVYGLPGSGCRWSQCCDL